jgi:hypothetical protein
MARRILNRKELRADFDAAERRETDAEEVEEGDEEEGDDDEEAEGDAEAGDDEGDDDEGDDDEAPKKKKKPVKEAKPKAKPKAKPRTRTPKVVRMKVVWGVFNNSNQRIAVFEYPKRAEAEDKARQLTADKKSTHFVQPVKEPIEEKKE